MSSASDLKACPVKASEGISSCSSGGAHPLPPRFLPPAVPTAATREEAVELSLSCESESADEDAEEEDEEEEEDEDAEASLPVRVSMRTAEATRAAAAAACAALLPGFSALLFTFPVFRAGGGAVLSSSPLESPDEDEDEEDDEAPSPAAFSAASRAPRVLRYMSACRFDIFRRFSGSALSFSSSPPRSPPPACTAATPCALLGGARAPPRLVIAGLAALSFERR